MNNIDILIPVCNEQDNVKPVIQKIHSSLSGSFNNINVIFIDDGSTDNTPEVISNLKKGPESLNIKLVKLTNNFGKDLAIKCGMDYSSADLCAIIDGDLQQPPEKIIEASNLIKQGYNVVHIEKKAYKNARIFRRVGTFFFTKFISFLFGGVFHLTDYKVIDSKTVGMIKLFKEVNFFNRGIVELIGLKSIVIYYNPLRRIHGESKYSFFNALKLAINSSISVSLKPLRISIYFGFIISAISFIFGLFILYQKIFIGVPILGFATIALATIFLGGIQLICLGVISEYLGKTFIESKNRPQYMIDYIKEI